MTELPVHLSTPLADRYRVERRIGAGATAAVYAARDLEADTVVAVKVLHAEYARVVGVDRFLREIALLRRLVHPHIMPLLDQGQAGPFPFYVMPFAAEGSLRERLERSGPLPFADASALLRGVAGALDHAHGAGVIHRDIKPENIVFDGGRALVCDFGVARALERAGGEALSSSGFVVGTPAYMSPEQAAGAELDGRSDIYSLGCVLFEALTGEPPFTGATAQAVLARHVSQAPPRVRVLRPDVPAALDGAVLAALAKRPDDRPASGAALTELAAA